MRSVGLDLGARHIAFCEVEDGEIVRKGAVRRLSELKELLGPDLPRARVAFEACREGWHVHDTLREWGHEPLMLDTTRVRQLGIGQHGRKNDAIDAEVIARAVEAGRVPLAHVLSPERRALRAKLSVRGELVDMRSRQVTMIRDWCGRAELHCRRQRRRTSLRRSRKQSSRRRLVRSLRRS